MSKDLLALNIVYPMFLKPRRLSINRRPVLGELVLIHSTIASLFRGCARQILEHSGAGNAEAEPAGATLADKSAQANQNCYVSKFSQHNFGIIAARCAHRREHALQQDILC